MQCNSKFRNSALLMAVSMFFFTACHQQNVNPNLSADDNGGYASDASRVEFATDDAISLADEAGTLYNSAFMRTTYTGNCALVGVDTIHTPHVLTIYFGNTDCQCLDGRNRRGTIVISYSGHYNDSAQVHTISFDNYYVNDNQLSGVIQTLRSDDTTVTGDWYYKVQVNDSLNVSQDPLNSQISAWVGNLERKWVSGYNTTNRTNEVFSISGSATLTRPNGHVFTCAIATPLQVAIGCNFVESGVINVSGYYGARRLDYGTGSCDPAAELYIGNTAYSLTMVE